MSAQLLETPCSKCGGAVVQNGVPYVEEKALCGCRACSWWGERRPSHVGAPCPRCEAPVTERAFVGLHDGTVLA